MVTREVRPAFLSPAGEILDIRLPVGVVIRKRTGRDNACPEPFKRPSEGFRVPNSAKGGDPTANQIGDRTRLPTHPLKLGWRKRDRPNGVPGAQFWMSARSRERVGSSTPVRTGEQDQPRPAERGKSVREGAGGKKATVPKGVQSIDEDNVQVARQSAMLEAIVQETKSSASSSSIPIFASATRSFPWRWGTSGRFSSRTSASSLGPSSPRSSTEDGDSFAMLTKPAGDPFDDRRLSRTPTVRLPILMTVDRHGSSLSNLDRTQDCDCGRPPRKESSRPAAQPGGFLPIGPASFRR